MAVTVGAGAGSSSGAGSDVVLLVAESASPLHARIRNHWIALCLFGLGVLAVAATLGTFLARSLTRPLEGIEAAVAAVGAGRLSERAPVARGPNELKALGETVNEMADRLEELVHTQRAFLADASHQLRTPLTALRLRLENLEDTLEAENRGDLSAALAEADRLSRIVDGLLTLARSEGGVRPPREAVDVAATLRDRAEAWTALAEERQVSSRLRRRVVALAAATSSGVPGSSGTGPRQSSGQRPRGNSAPVERCHLRQFAQATASRSTSSTTGPE